MNQLWQPGFESSDGESTLWIERRQLTEQARDFEYHGRLPIIEAETTEACGPRDSKHRQFQRTEGMSVFEKSFPLNRSGRPVALARA